MLGQAPPPTTNTSMFGNTIFGASKFVMNMLKECKRAAIGHQRIFTYLNVNNVNGVHSCPTIIDIVTAVVIVLLGKVTALIHLRSSRTAYILYFITKDICLNI